MAGIGADGAVFHGLVIKIVDGVQRLADGDDILHLAVGAKHRIGDHQLPERRFPGGVSDLHVLKHHYPALFPVYDVRNADVDLAAGLKIVYIIGQQFRLAHADGVDVGAVYIEVVSLVVQDVDPVRNVVQH